ncbi:tumor necrosis factor receptor superfamily member 13C-like [Electrophorus electricus]|uniref:Uncharacterized protein n=2 Tax=Electrophorus TaxID=8004 RepID=A0A4W4FVS6_ELEEL|nr:tumor necrosis factor receptor superfamily member 13C-like [Electrophorus electricus]
MEKQSCSPGLTWDPLVKDCTTLDTLEKPQLPVNADFQEARSPRSPAGSWSQLNPTMWVCVGVVMCNTLLALLLWFFIYRRLGHNTGKRNPDSPAGCDQNGTLLRPPLLRVKGDPPASCPHTNGRIQEVSICEMGQGWDTCTGRVEHGIPLPATELGDSALVTTKTVQPVEV